MGVTSRKFFRSRLAVCSWSLQPTDPATLLARVQAAGFSFVQLDLDPFRESSAAWESGPELWARAGVQVVAGMFRTLGEDYTTIESIRRTGGIVPDHTWEGNLANARFTAVQARRLGIPFVTFHAGFLPHSPSDPAYKRILDRVRTLARVFAEQGIVLGLETGQETAEALEQFLLQLDEPNVAVNFDPANMLLYGSGDPIQTLEHVGRWVRGVHIKDAIPSSKPGEWGEEVRVGTGRVDWRAFFELLDRVGFQGWLCFEREAGDRRVEDLRSGREWIEQLLAS